jgi:hypothetical protein
MLQESLMALTQQESQLELQIKQAEINMQLLEAKINKALSLESESTSKLEARIAELGVLIELVNKYGLEMENQINLLQKNQM